MSEPDLARYVTRDELALTLNGILVPLSEIRSMLRDEIRVVQTGQSDLSAQLLEMQQEITNRQDLADGRTGKLEERLTATLAEVHTIAGLAEHIDNEGCAQREAHVEELRALALVRARPEWTALHAATTAGITVGAVVVAVLGTYGIPWLHRLIHWLLGM